MKSIQKVNVNELEKELEQRSFKHRSWFKEGRTTAYALKSLATCLTGTWIEEKEKKQKGEYNPFNKDYELVIKSSGSKSFYRPKDDKELYYFTFHALQFEKEQIKKMNNDNDYSNIDELNKRYDHVEEFYSQVLEACIIS